MEVTTFQFHGKNKEKEIGEAMDQNKKRVELYEDKSQTVRAAIDKIAVDLINKSNNSSQVLLFTGCSPVAGTTTTCIGVGIAVAAGKRKTILVDCDVRRSAKYKKLNDNVNGGLAEFLNAPEKITDESIGKITYASNIENLYYIPCGECEVNPTRILCSVKMKELLEALRQKYDYVILDCPSINIVPDAKVMFGAADGIITIAALGETRKGQIKNAKRMLKDYSDRYYGMIINKIEGNMYKRCVKDYDYYFVNDKGEQHLQGNISNKMKKKEKIGDEKKN
jgi:capsular exopolysaccharide synthesis family protein